MFMDTDEHLGEAVFTKLFEDQLRSMEEVIIDSFVEDIPTSVDIGDFVRSSFDEELSNMSVPSSDVGIEATDLGSLLEQFEEVSETLDIPDSITDSVVPDIEKKENIINIPASTDKKELTEEMLQKFKSSTKQKTTVMLPLAVPAKRGRGRAMTRGHPVALPVNCTPRRLQRVMLQHQELIEGLPEVAVEIEKVSKVKKKEGTVGLDENFFELSDHDYIRTGSCSRIQNDSENKEINERSKKSEKNSGIKERCESSEVKVLGESEGKENVQKSEVKVTEDSEGKENIQTGLEDGEVVEDEESLAEAAKPSKVDRRSKAEDNVEYIHDGQFFDKLPSYYTALSIPRKSTKKTASHVTGRGGISVHDYIERDMSPIRDTSGYNKLPDYHSSFTNSTKYDHMTSNSLEESKDSSGYYSPSRRSPSCNSERSRSRSYSRSRSRHSHSRSKSQRRSRRNSERRQSSYSPYSGGFSSRSCSRSSCCSSSSRSSSCSSSSYCSTCDSRSSSLSRSPSPSPDRAWERESRFRGDRSRQRRSRSRSKSRSYSRGKCYTSRPENPYRGKSSSVSRDRSPIRDRFKERSPIYDDFKDRRREERKKEREQEKEQQMKERRIVYVGGLPNKYTRQQLRSNFGRFGDIEHIQLHFREHGDNYGFVTFSYTCDAYAAIEKGKLVPELKKFDLCFGGRRQFCDVEYADLDGNKEVEEEFDTKPKSGDFDFDELLRQARQKLKK